MIKKSKTLIFLIILISFLLLAGFVEANGERSFQQIFEKLTEEFVKWATYLAAIAIGVCAVLIASSGGDPVRLANAKRALVYVVIGLAIVEVGKGIATTPTTISAITDIQSGAKIIAKDLGTVAAIVGTIFLIYGIFEIATSAGDPRKLNEAKTIILWSVVGISLGALGATGGFGTIITEATAKSAAEKIIHILGWIAYTFGTIFIIFGTFKFATSGGNPIAITEAKMNIFWGVVGIALGGMFYSAAIEKILTFFGIKWK